MTRSNELGMPIWLSTSRFAPPTDILRTKQSIPEPSNEIVPAFMTFWRWVSRSWPIRTPFCPKAFKISLSRPLAFYTRGNDHGFPIRCSSAFHKTTAASPQANDSCWERLVEPLHLWASLKPIDTTASGAIEILRCNNAVKKVAYHGKPRPCDPQGAGAWLPLLCSAFGVKTIEGNEQLSCSELTGFRA